jgi:hypothetical protein
LRRFKERRAQNDFAALQSGAIGPIWAFKTARALGTSIPRTALAGTDEVIE